MRRWFAFVFFAGLLWQAQAHQPGLSTVFIRVSTNALDVEMILSWQELEEVIPLDSDQNRQLSNDEFAAAKAKLIKLGRTALDVESDGKPLNLLLSDVHREDETGVRFVSRWELPQTERILVRSRILDDLQRGHRQIFSIRGVTNALVAETTLTHERNSVEVSLSGPAAEQGRGVHTVGQFLWLGVEHILTGWDHLTFLFGLLLVGGRGRDVTKIITSFTIAHSLTLALATFNLIRLPSSFVEAAIAGSIVYVGIENMLRHNYRGRWALTFAFGLIHGCGFATALRELGVGADGGSVLKPLVCFNVGVETGQLAIAGAVLPWIWKLKPRFVRWWVPVFSTLVAVIGAWFLLQRTLL